MNVMVANHSPLRCTSTGRRGVPGRIEHAVELLEVGARVLLDFVLASAAAASSSARSGRRPGRCSRRRSARPGARGPGTGAACASPTVWPRWMSGAVGSKPCLTRSGRFSRDASARAARAARPRAADSSVPRARDRELVVRASRVDSGRADAWARDLVADRSCDARNRTILAACTAGAGSARQLEPTTLETGVTPLGGRSDRSSTDPWTASRPSTRVRPQPVPLEALPHPRRRSRCSAPPAPCSASSSGCGRDLPTPEQLTPIQAPVKTVVYDARGRVLHEFFKENRSLGAAAGRSRAPGQRHALDRGPQLLPALGRRPVGRRRAPRSATCCTCARAAGRQHDHAAARAQPVPHARAHARRASSRRSRSRSRSSAATRRTRSSRCTSTRSTSARAPTASRPRPGPTSASRFSELTLPECALLAGLPANPSVYSPRRQPGGRAARGAPRCCATCSRPRRSRRSSSTTRSTRRSA